MTLNKIKTLIIPTSILGPAITALYDFIASDWTALFSTYLLALSVLFIFTAKQSLAIQTMDTWDIGELSDEERSKLAEAITKDFIIFGAGYALAFTLAYWGAVYIYNPMS